MILYTFSMLAFVIILEILSSTSEKTFRHFCPKRNLLRFHKIRIRFAASNLGLCYYIFKLWLSGVVGKLIFSVHFWTRSILSKLAAAESFTTWQPAALIICTHLCDFTESFSSHFITPVQHFPHVVVKRAIYVVSAVLLIYKLYFQIISLFKALKTGHICNGFEIRVVIVSHNVVVALRILNHQMDAATVIPSL